MTPEQIEHMDPETHADGFTPMWGYVVAWEKYKDMAAHIIAQREQIAALEKRVKASRGALADIFDGEPQWPHKPKKELKWCRNRAEEAYRATGGQDNE